MQVIFASVREHAGHTHTDKGKIVKGGVKFLFRLRSLSKKFSYLIMWPNFERWVSLVTF